MTRADIVESLAKAIPEIDFSGEAKTPRRMKSFSHANLCQLAHGILDELDRLGLKVVRA